MLQLLLWQCSANSSLIRQLTSAALSLIYGFKRIGSICWEERVFCRAFLGAACNKNAHCPYYAKLASTLNEAGLQYKNIVAFLSFLFLTWSFCMLKSLLTGFVFTLLTARIKKYDICKSFLNRFFSTKKQKRNRNDKMFLEPSNLK